jgi:cell division septation protein DedD
LQAQPPPAASARIAAAAPPPEKIHKPALYLQVGAYSDQANAERAASTLRGAQLGTVRVVEGNSNGRAVRRVRIGPLRDGSLKPGEWRALTQAEVRALYEAASATDTSATDTSATETSESGPADVETPG